MTDRYAVMGNPIAHSKSPVIHSRFAAATGERITYTALLVPLEGFEASVREFVAGGGKGLNVTVPFKEQAWALASERTSRAEIAGAVNTLWFGPNGEIFGDNTDGVGLVRDLEENHGLALAGRRILLLGAGGAARGVLAPLLGRGPAELFVANRTTARAEALAREFSAVGPVRAGGFRQTAGGGFDLIINATSASLEQAVPPVPFDALVPRGTCYDFVYAEGPTLFQRWARAAGADLALDGLGMLVEQAAEAFSRWRGVRPRTAPVIAALRGASSRP